MRNIEIEAYKLNELSGAAKEAALDSFRNQQYPHYDWIYTEAHESFKAFCDLFSIRWDSIDWEEMYRSEWSIKLEEDIKELSGQRLATYIWNNHRSEIYSRKYYGPVREREGSITEPMRHPMRRNYQITNECPNKGLWFSQHYSNIQIEQSCPFTGVCYDASLLDPMWEFINSPDKRDFEILLNDCIHNLAQEISSEIEYHNSEEAILEHCEANEYEFDQEGSRI